MPDDIKPTEQVQATPVTDEPPADIDMSLPAQPPAELPKSRWQAIRDWPLRHKKISLPIILLLILTLFLVIPWSRYKICGLVINQNFSVRVVDATTKAPVSGATVIVNNHTAETDATGTARLKLRVGHANITVSKKYYLSSSANGLVPVFKQKKTPIFSLQATGRQVKVSIADLLTNKSLANVDIEVAGISAKTDSKGQALLVLPAGITKQQATLSLDGYNDAAVAINVSDQKVAQNNLTMTPSGKVYFLSNRSGSLDIMKVNLDGTDPEVVVKGTASEDVGSTALSQSPDGKYVVLEAKRQPDDKTPQLYVLATADDQLYNFDSGDVGFGIIGWSGDSLIYTASSNTMANWQPGKQKIKSYDASSGKTSVVDSSAGSDPTKVSYESYGQIYLTANKVVFDKNWSTDGSDDLSGQKNTVMSANVNGQSKQTVTSYMVSTTTISLYQYAPNEFYVVIADNNSGNDTYYDYSPGGNFKKISQPSDTQLYSGTQYFISPDDSQSVWSEQRDGKQTLIVADTYGSTTSQQVQVAGYDAAGWYSNKYLLATDPHQSNLYIMAPGHQPVKLTSYQPTYIY